MNSSHPSPIDAARVRALFVRRHPASFVVREVASRMGERLDLMRLEPARVLDAGCGSNEDQARLATRFPLARVIGLDLAPLRQHLKKPRRPWSFLTRRASADPLVAGDFRALPLASASIDMIWSNCALHWLSDAEDALSEWSRVLRPDGLVLFSCFGPDTLKEVRVAFGAIDAASHTLAFTDLHDYGDMLLGAGFAAPVMDMERITLTYDTAALFWADVRALGGNPLAGARRGLYSRAQGRRLSEALDAQRDENGQLRLTFEVVYGHAWKAQKMKRGDGLAVIAPPARRQSR